MPSHDLRVLMTSGPSAGPGCVVPGRAVPRLSRREFVAYCGRLAALLALGRTGAPDVADALAGVVERRSLAWSSFAGCNGCTVSLLQNASPGPAELLIQAASLGYQETLMAATGGSAVTRFTETAAAAGSPSAERALPIYVVEGAIPTAPAEAMRVGGRTALAVALETVPHVAHIIAVGNCAAYGGATAAAPNPTMAKGVRDVLPKEVRDRVICLPTCPGNGDSLVAVLAHIEMLGRPPELDELGRPTFLFSSTVHEHCTRRARYENGELVTRFGTAAEEKHHCLLPVGCKGPRAYAPCARLRWNDHANWCVGVGPCIGCSEPRAWDRMTPLYSPPAGSVRGAGIQGTSAEAFAALAATASAVGMGAHFIGEAANHRLPWKPSPGEYEPPLPADPDGPSEPDAPADPSTCAELGASPRPRVPPAPGEPGEDAT